MKWRYVILLTIWSFSGMITLCNDCTYESNTLTTPQNPFYTLTKAATTPAADLIIIIWEPDNNSTYLTKYTIWINSTISGGTTPYTAYYRIDSNSWNNYTCDTTECYQYVTFPGGDHTVTVNATDAGGGEDTDSVTLHFYLKSIGLGGWDKMLFIPVFLTLILLYFDEDRKVRGADT